MNRKAALGLAALGCVAAGVGIFVLSGGIATAPPAAPQPPAAPAPPEDAVAAPGDAGPSATSPSGVEATPPSGKKMVITGIVTGTGVEAATFYAEQQGRTAESPVYTVDLRWQRRNVQCRFTSKVGIDRLDDGVEATIAGTHAGTAGETLILKDCQLLQPSLD
jgi:hypothetical protein